MSVIDRAYFAPNDSIVSAYIVSNSYSASFRTFWLGLLFTCKDEEAVAFFGVRGVVIAASDRAETEASFMKQEFQLMGIEIVVGGLGDGAVECATFGGSGVVEPSDVEGLGVVVELAARQLYDDVAVFGIGEGVFQGEQTVVGGGGDGGGVDEVDE